MKALRRNLMIVISILTSMVPYACRKADSITVSKAELSWISDGGKKMLDISANCEWTVSCRDWIICDPASGSGTGQIAVRALKNDGLERKDILTSGSFSGWC